MSDAREDRIRKEILEGEWETLWHADLRFLIAKLDQARKQVEMASDLWKRHQQTKFKSDGSHFQIDIELNDFFAKLKQENE